MMEEDSRRSERLARLALTAVSVLVIGGLIAWGLWRQHTATYVFQGVVGPASVSTVEPPALARIDAFDTRSPHRLAVLVTDPDSDWLGLLRGFRSHGVPVRFTRDPDTALEHRVVLVYPIVSGKVLTPEALRSFSAHVRDGGTVLAFELAGGGLQDVFGVEGYTPARTRNEVVWERPGGVAEEDRIRVSSEDKLWTLGYQPTTATVLARFDDDSAAVTCRTAGGMACLMGLDLGRLAQLGMDGRAEPINRSYVNGYEPSLDVLFRWVRDLYVEHETMPWLLSTVPDDRAAALLITHDVDYGPSVANAERYAQVLRDRGVEGTFFIQTKFRRDWNDEVFFDPDAVEVVNVLRERGMEVASHSVAHAIAFEHMEIGTGQEQYPDYRPFVDSRDTAVDGTILGELRVSKFLLETLGGLDVTSFRPGHLSYPFALPQALEATGYRYSSSLTANRTLTHLPYQLTHDRAGRALVPVYEFPVTIEDEAPPRLGERFDAMHEVAAKIARHGGTVVLLNHPDITGHKLEFETRLIEAWQDTAWIGSVRQFGAWWAARDQLDVDVRQVDGRWILEASSADAIEGLVVHLPKAKAGRLQLDLKAGATHRETL